MPQKSSIEWTDYTSNPVYANNTETNKRGWFCVKVSPGCGHCYAENLNVGRFGNKLHFTENNLEKVEFVLNENELLKIIQLNKSLAKKGETKNLFLGDMADIFLEQIPDKFLDKIFAVMALCTNINFQILTKRAERMLDYCQKFINHSHLDDFHCWASEMADWLCYIGVREAEYEHDSQGEVCDSNTDEVYEELLDSFESVVWGEHTFLPNVWLGASVENRKAKHRIDLVRQTPAAVHFLSLEPLLEDLGELDLTDIDWVIVGGESGHGARPCNISWIRVVVHQCRAVKIPVFVKQLGAVPMMCEVTWRNTSPTRLLNYRNSQKVFNGFVPILMSDKKGGLIDEFPKDLQIRQYPNQTI